MSGFQTKYKELFTVSVKQPFYTNGYCKEYTTLPSADFTIVPTEECREIMKRLDLVFRLNDSKCGFIILARVSGTNMGGDDLLKFTPGADDKLTFHLIINNPAVLNINDLPTSADKEKIFYFSNDNADGAALRNDLHISRGVAGVITVNDQIKKAGGIYKFHKMARVGSGTAVISHNVSGNELEPTSISVTGNESDLEFDLTNFPSGKCKLLINGIENDSFYNMGSTLGKLTFGVVELFLNDSIPSNYRIVEADYSLTTQRPQFVVPFIVRNTIWRYTFNLKPSGALYQYIESLSDPDKVTFFDTINIVSNDNNIKFSMVVATETQLQFVSDTAIPLQEKYYTASGVTLNIALRRYIISEVDVRSFLPYPDPSTIYASNGTIYSDIFITI